MKQALVVVAAIAVLAVVVAYLLLARGGPKTVDEAERNRRFTEEMARVTLVGHSTRLNKEGLFGPERYHIESVKHVSGDLWLFQTRFEYGGKELPFPLPIQVRWAGDTPVITVTDLAIPGGGTYTARVVLYRGQYAGTWSAQSGGGGQLFGRIERAGAAQ